MRTIENFTIFNGFSCCPPEEKDTDIDDFIRHDARRYFRDKVAVTYGLFFDEPGEKAANTPLGFATLQNDIIPILLKDYYPNMPAVKIGRFGINREIHGKGFGTHFLTMIYLFMSQPDNRTGCRFLTLNTYPPLVKFYEKNNFTVFGGSPANPKPTQQLIMYLDLVSKSVHRNRPARAGSPGPKSA
jgi:GNAT superfamily N-acetyltransferase